jgi:very-short-patch-repair endonuclease
LVCEICGNEFTCPPSQDKTRRFCGYACFYKWLNGFEQKPRIEVNCLTCGKPMRVLESRYKDGKRGRYCSQECMIANRLHKPNGKLIKRICLNCGKDFYKLECQVYGNRGRFCSRGCVGAYVIKNMRSNGPTSIEVILKEAFDIAGLEYEIQYSGVAPWIIDFAFPGYKLAVEADGDYWHSLDNVIEKDKRKDSDLNSKGWTIIHLSESDIKQSISTCVERVIGHLTIL